MNTRRWVAARYRRQASITAATGYRRLTGIRLSADVVVRPVQRDRELHLQRLAGQAVDAGHPAGGRDGDRARAEAEAVRVVGEPAEAEHLVVVVERLAHAHQDHVADPGLVAARLARRPQELLEDLARPQVPAEPHRARWHRTCTPARSPTATRRRRRADLHAASAPSRAGSRRRCGSAPSRCRRSIAAPPRASARRTAAPARAASGAAWRASSPRPTSRPARASHRAGPGCFGTMARPTRRAARWRRRAA